jgi:hypothetical protein
MRSWLVPLPRFAAIFAAMEISLLFDNAVVNTSDGVRSGLNPQRKNSRAD